MKPTLRQSLSGGRTSDARGSRRNGLGVATTALDTLVSVHLQPPCPDPLSIHQAAFSEAFVAGRRPRRARRPKRVARADFQNLRRHRQRWSTNVKAKSEALRPTEVLCGPGSVCSSRESVIAQMLGIGLGDRLGDDQAMRVRHRGNKKAICWPFVKPSDGLEPSTPSL
jgi:hypothetical protein